MVKLDIIDHFGLSKWNYRVEKNRSDDFWPIKFDFLVFPISRSNRLRSLVEDSSIICHVIFFIRIKVNSSCLQVATGKILSILTSDMLNNTTCYFLDFGAAFKLAWLLNGEFDSIH